MRRTIHGVPFLVYSPSHLVLDAINDGAQIERCVLWFDGSRWLIHVKMCGRTVLKQFASRDAAILAMGGQRHVA